MNKDKYFQFPTRCEVSETHTKYLLGKLVTESLGYHAEYKNPINL